MLLDRFRELYATFSRQKVVVLGDVMLDTYVWGGVSRISPEAPIPLVEVERIEHRPGGAANVALNLGSLGAQVALVGLIGDDPAGKQFDQTLSRFGLEHSIVVEPHRPTTEKTRIIAGSQHVLRMDTEVVSPPAKKYAGQLLEATYKALEGADALILQDYQKGVFSPAIIRAVCKHATENEYPVYVDPKDEHFDCYQGVRLIKPNEHEAAGLVGWPFKSDADIRKAGTILRERLRAEVVLLTRGAAGMDLFDADGYHRIATKARKVADVCGAGDTVIATYVLANLAGASAFEAATLANYAAGTVVEEMGVVPVNLERLEALLKHYA